MDQDKRESMKYPREGEQEQEFRIRFQEYEEWRAAQSDKPDELLSEEEPKKTFGFSKLDFLFLGLGMVAAMVFRSCSSQ